jgi:medium-chain acyl-[acyl-carrier-protein] hydrolase
MNIYTKKFDITFSDIDENNKLSNKGILRIMQEIAGLHSSSLGYGLNDAPKTGFAWLLLNWKLKVFSRPKWEGTLTVNTWSKSMNPLFAYRDIEIFDDKNNLVAVGSSKWILFDINKQSLCKIPNEVKEKFPSVDKSVFEEKFVEKLKEPENSNFIYEYTIQRRDIDTNHHVNNLNYLDYAYQALPEAVYSNTNFSNVEIMYKHEAKLGDTISIFCSNTEKNEHVITIKDEEGKKLHAIIKLY